MGASAFGRVVYESTTPDLIPGSGTYAGAVTEFEVTIGSYEAGPLAPSSLNAFYVRVRGGNWYDLKFANGLTGPDVLFSQLLIMTLGLIADTPGVIPDSSLPMAPASLSALRPFSIADWFTLGFGTGLQLYRADPDEQVLVEFTRLEAVPEPAIFAIVAPFLLALVAIRRR